MVKINKQEHKIPENNYYKSPTKKSQIIIGLSLRKNDYHIKRHYHKEYGFSKKWNTFTISRGGEIFQHYNPKFYSDYIGSKAIDKKSISIVLENMGALQINNDGEYINWLNEVCESYNVIEKRWMGQRYWECITNEQIESIIGLSKYLCDEFNIQKNVIEFHHYHKDLVKFNGIVLKSNYFEDSNNISPLINLNEIKNSLN